MCDNTCFFTKRASKDLTGDETSYATGSFGPACTGLIGRVHTKPHVKKGGQAFCLVDTYHYRLYGYSHRHKLHPSPEQGWNQQGPNEVRRVCQQFLDYHIKDDGRHIFTEPPHLCLDNHFSGDKIINWLGTNGFAATMTCRRDRLPATIPGKYLHKEKTDASKVTKVARYLEPVVAIKIVKKTDEVPATATTPAIPEKKGYTLIHASFQSTSSTNISGVNNINSCKTTIHKRERGRGKNKRVWGIEMNEARDLVPLYLSWC